MFSWDIIAESTLQSYRLARERKRLQKH